jgi:hypothetical protein
LVGYSSIYLRLERIWKAGSCAGFISLQEGLDTTTSGGKLIFKIFRALAEFEKNLICKWTNAGLATARARGRKGGRNEKLKSAQVETKAKDISLAATHDCRDLPGYGDHQADILFAHEPGIMNF